MVERHHARADALHQPHVVLDQQDRQAAVADALDVGHQFAGLARVHAGGRFVEQQQARARWPVRVRSPGAGDWRRTARSAGDRARGARRDPNSPSSSSRAAVRPLPSRHARRAAPSMIASSPALVRGTMPASTFSSTVIWLNRRWFWNVRAMPQRVTRCGGRRADVGVLGETDRARRRRMDAGQDIEERRLARAVRADDADDLARIDIEIDGLQRVQAAEILAQPAHLQQRRAVIGDVSMDGANRREAQLPRFSVLTCTKSGPFT